MADLVDAAREALELVQKRNIRVIVCGGRDYDDERTVFDVLDQVHEHHRITHLFHGNARGADRLAHRWAGSIHNPKNRVRVFPKPAQWKKHGKRAGPFRNQAMLGQSPDLVIAFPGGRGTADMVSRARKAGVPVLHVPTPPSQGGKDE